MFFWILIKKNKNNENSLELAINNFNKKNMNNENSLELAINNKNIRIINLILQYVEIQKSKLPDPTISDFNINLNEIIIKNVSSIKSDIIILLRDYKNIINFKYKDNSILRERIIKNNIDDEDEISVDKDELNDEILNDENNDAFTDAETMINEDPNNDEFEDFYGDDYIERIFTDEISDNDTESDDDSISGIESIDKISISGNESVDKISIILDGN